VFWNKEVFNSISDKVSNLLSQTNEAINNLEKTGSDVSSLRDAYQEAVGRWDDYHYDVSSTLESIISLSGHWEKIGSSFTLAEGLINSLDDENPQKAKLERILGEARTAWKSAIGSVENSDFFDNYYREAETLLLDIIDNLEARNAIIEGNLFNITEMNLMKIADPRKKLMDTNKFNQSKKLFDSGEYATSLTYLNQIGEPGPPISFLLLLLFPTLRRLVYGFPT